jgi:hypothetical protein
MTLSRRVMTLSKVSNDSAGADVEPFHERDQRRAFQPQTGGGSVLSTHLASGFCQGLQHLVAARHCNFVSFEGTSWDRFRSGDFSRVPGAP